MSVSKHAGERLRERCGFNKKTIERMADKAFKEGIPHSKTKGRLECVHIKIASKIIASIITAIKVASSLS